MKKLISSIALITSLALVMSGCTFASAMVQLDKYLPIALQAAEAIIAILVQGGVIKVGQATQVSTDLNISTAVLKDVEAAVAAYNAAPASDKDTKLEAVITALNAAQAQFAQTITDLRLNGNSNAVLAAQAGLEVIITTLAAIQVNLPVPTTATVKAQAKKSKLSIFKPSYASQFKSQFNAAVGKYGFSNHAI